jgi:hypothetical protein
MSHRFPIFSILGLLIALGAQAASPGAAPSGHRVELPGAQGKPFPYTIEIPHDWQVRQVKGIPGVWLGPTGAEPPEDPRLLYVRMSHVSLADPQKVVQSIRANDVTAMEWSASELEVREIGGVKGVWVRRETGEGAKARSTITLKLPVGASSVDFIASVPPAEYKKLGALAEKLILTVRPLKP